MKPQLQATRQVPELLPMSGSRLRLTSNYYCLSMIVVIIIIVISCCFGIGKAAAAPPCSISSGWQVDNLNGSPLMGQTLATPSGPCLLLFLSASTPPVISAYDVTTGSKSWDWTVPAAADPLSIQAVNNSAATILFVLTAEVQPNSAPPSYCSVLYGLSLADASTVGSWPPTGHRLCNISQLAAPPIQVGKFGYLLGNIMAFSGLAPNGGDIIFHMDTIQDGGSPIVSPTNHMWVTLNEQGVTLNETSVPGISEVSSSAGRPLQPILLDYGRQGLFLYQYGQPAETFWTEVTQIGPDGSFKQISKHNTPYNPDYFRLTPDSTIGNTSVILATSPILCKNNNEYYAEDDRADPAVRVWDLTVDDTNGTDLRSAVWRPTGAFAGTNWLYSPLIPSNRVYLQSSFIATSGAYQIGVTVFDNSLTGGTGQELAVSANFTGPSGLVLPIDFLYALRDENGATQIISQAGGSVQSLDPVTFAAVSSYTVDFSFSIPSPSVTVSRLVATDGSYIALTASGYVQSIKGVSGVSSNTFFTWTVIGIIVAVVVVVVLLILAVVYYCMRMRKARATGEGTEALADTGGIPNSRRNAYGTLA